MLANFFGKSKPISIVVTILLFFVLYSFAVIGGKVPFQISVLPLFLLVFGIVIFIIVKNNLTFDNSYAFLIFVILIGFFPRSIQINATFYANLTLLLFLRKAYSLQSSKKLFQKLFDAGFWLGISFLTEPFIVVFGLLLYTSIYFHKRLTIRTLIIPALGFFVPVFLYFTYTFWHDKTVDFKRLFIWFTNYNFDLYKNSNYLFLICFIGFFVLISGFFKTPRALAIKNDFRKNWILILLHFSLSLVLLILTKNKNESEFLYILFPSALILANGLEIYQKKRISDITLFLFLIIAITTSFM